MSTATKGGGHWVTVKKEGPLHGRHLFIDGSGQVTKGKGIPAHVIHHLNSNAGKGHLEGAEPHEPDHMKRAAKAATEHKQVMAWRSHLKQHDPEAFAAVDKHIMDSNSAWDPVFQKLKKARQADTSKQDEEADSLQRAKDAAPNHKDADDWLAHLGSNDMPAFMALGQHAHKTDAELEDLFSKFDGGSKAQDPDEPAEHDDDLKRAKAEAPNHASHEDWVDHLNKHDGKAYNALSWHDSKPADLFKKWGGGSKADQTPKGPGHPTPEAHPEHVEKALVDHERTTRHKATEEGTLHHPGTGEKVWGEDQGSHNEVNLSDAISKGLVKGNVLTHNHPQGNSFSNEDIRFMLAHDLKEMRAVSKKHLHRIQAPEGYKNTEENFADMQGKISGIEDSIRSEMWDKINSGKLTPDAASAMHFHELWTRAAKQLGFKYSREEHSDGGDKAREQTADYSGGEIKDHKDLMNKWKAQGAKVDVYPGRAGLDLSRIVFDKADRSKGKGTAFMNDLTGLADRTGQRVTLTPSSEFGGAVSRLKDFYKRFGFVENKGRNKDLSISAGMYREAKGDGKQ